MKDFFHELLSFGAWDQSALVANKSPSVKFHRPEQVLKRLARRHYSTILAIQPPLRRVSMSRTSS